MADEPKTETEGSSRQTAIATGVGAVVAVATAPIWVPFFGLGAAAAAVGTVGVAAAGAAVGYLGFGKK